jgi:hypothetical protein
MTNINLATSGLPQKQGMPYKKGIISIVIMLAILAGGYGWLTFESGKVKSETIAVNSDYQAEYQKLINNNKDIVDFQNRITLVKNLLSKENRTLGSLSELEKNLLPGAYLTEYALNGSNLKLSIVANDFDVLARQVASFKSSSSFSGVSVGKSSLNDKNKVVSEIVLNVN